MLAYVSPTRYASLRACPLRVAFDLGRASRGGSKRPSPAALPGIAAHNALQELVKTGRIGSPDLARHVADAWRSAVAKILGVEGSDRDLARILPPYYLYAARLGNVARTLASLLENAVTSQTEVPLSSLDGRLRGTADLLVTERDGIWIADYKARLRDPATNARVAHDYAVQLRLYAYMVHEVTDQWPDRAMLLPLDGKPVPVDIGPDSCEEAASLALQALVEFQRTPEADQPAYPSPSACRFCSHAAACGPFGASVDASWADEMTAMVGVVAEVESSAQGTIAIRLRLEAGSIEAREIWLVRVTRPLLPGGLIPAPGARLAAAGLAATGQVGTYTVRDMTVISVVES